MVTFNDKRQAEQFEYNRDEKVAEIAEEVLMIRTLYSRFSDSLDFHDVHCENVAAALKAAYDAGYEAAKEAE